MVVYCPFHFHQLFIFFDIYSGDTSWHQCPQVFIVPENLQWIMYFLQRKIYPVVTPEQKSLRGNPLRLDFSGAPGRIRTCDLRIRSPALYPAELRAQIKINWNFLVFKLYELSCQW